MIKKSIKIEGNEIEFQLIESDMYWCWQGSLEISDMEIIIEIDCGFHKGEVNWVNVEQFLKYVSQNDIIKKYSHTGIESITKVGKDFFSNSPETREWKMEFNKSIYYLGKTENNAFSYGFLYDFYVKTENGTDGDPYAIYIVKMENEKQITSERHQL